MRSIDTPRSRRPLWRGCGVGGPAVAGQEKISGDPVPTDGRRWRLDIGLVLMGWLYVQGLRLDDITTHKWTILPCSAMTGENLFEGLDWVVQDAKDRLFLY